MYWKVIQKTYGKDIELMQSTIPDTSLPICHLIDGYDTGLAGHFYGSLSGVNWQSCTC